MSTKLSHRRSVGAAASAAICCDCFGSTSPWQAASSVMARRATVYTTQAARSPPPSAQVSAVINTTPALERARPSPQARSRLLACRSSPLSAGPWAAPRDKTTHLFDLEVVGSQSLLDLLLRASRRRLHRASEPVQHPLERKLLHRE